MKFPNEPIPALREAVEEHLALAPQELPLPEDAGGLERLVEELRIHQEELRIQNHELIAAQSALEESRDRYSALYDFSPVGYLSLNRGGQITEINLTAARMLGTERAMLLDRPFGLWLAEGERRGRLLAYLGETLRLPGKHELEVALASKSGTTWTALLEGTAAKSVQGDQECRIAMADITERKRMAQALHRANRAYRAISACNKSVARASDEPEMLREVCELLVGIGGYLLAWIAKVERGKGNRVQSVAQAGRRKGYHDMPDISWVETGSGPDLIGKAVRTQATSIARDIRSDPALDSGCEGTFVGGAISAIAIPLVVRGEIWGILNLYASEPDAFNAEEAKLLEDLADDVVHGIDTLSVKRERVQTQALLECNLRDQEVVTSILTIAQQSAPLEEILERILDLVLTQRGLNLEKKGCIFLAEGEPKALVMKVHCGLSEPQLETCSRVSFGTCLCGRAAETGEMIYARAVDERHETAYPKMQPHGHYCVPISGDGEILGVLCFFLPAGAQSFEGETRLLVAVAETLVGVIRRKRSEDARSRLLEENRKLSRCALAVQEDERRYIARELHDELAQNLSGIMLFAKHMSETAHAVDAKLGAGMDEILELSTETVAMVRSLMNRLRPALLDQLGLSEALGDMVSKWRSRHPDVQCTFSVARELDDQDEDLQITLYRIVQESLTNIERYADPREVRIGLEQTNHRVRLDISDNGRGVDLSAAREGMGLIGMRERVESRQGIFEVQSRPGHGLTISVDIPASR